MQKQYSKLSDKEGVIYVGGPEGVFALWPEPRTYEWKGETKHQTLVNFYVGDDGAWWRVASYDRAWIPQIIKALQGL